MRETGHEPGLEKIARPPHDDRNGAGCLFGGANGRYPAGDNHVHPEMHQLGRERGKTIDLALRPAVLKDGVPAFQVTELPHGSPELVHEELVRRGGTADEQADRGDLSRWLCACRDCSEGKRRNKGEPRITGSPRDTPSTLIPPELPNAQAARPAQPVRSSLLLAAC